MVILGYGRQFELYRIIIKTDPPALIYVDGKQFGMSPITLWLHVGKRQIEARRVSYETTQNWLMIEEDKPNQTLTFQLPLKLKTGYQLPQNCFFMDLSWDNRWISYLCNAKSKKSRDELFVANIQSNQPVSLDPQPTAIDGATGSFSPDGKWFLLQYPFGPFYIYKVGDWNHARLLYYTQNFLGASPVWSPNGQMLAFANLKPGLEAISVLGVDGRNITILKKCQDPFFENEIPDICGPSWSSDSQFVLYKDYSTDYPKRWQWWTYEIATGKRRALVDFEKSGYYPEWSPDGTKIGFVYYTQTEIEIRIVDLNSGEIQKIATILQSDYRSQIQGLLFSPNNQYLAIIASANEIYIIPLDKNKPTIILEIRGDITRWTGDSNNLLGVGYDMKTLIEYTTIWEVK